MMGKKSGESEINWEKHAIRAALYGYFFIIIIQNHFYQQPVCYA